MTLGPTHSLGGGVGGVDGGSGRGGFGEGGGEGGEGGGEGGGVGGGVESNWPSQRVAASLFTPWGAMSAVEPAAKMRCVGSWWGRISACSAGCSGLSSLSSFEKVSIVTPSASTKLVSVSVCQTRARGLTRSTSLSSSE